jgi:tape measure domain-containing protein
MAIRAAELQVVIGADVNSALQGIRGAMGQIQQAGTTALGVFTGQVLFGAMQQVGQAFVGLGRDALQATVGWEQLRFSIESLTANELRAKDSTLSVSDALNMAKEQAADTLKWIQDLAIVSPFPTETVAQVFGMQMRMGQTSDQAKTLTKALLDMGAATGLSGENLYSAGLALSQIAASAKLSAQDLRQLINAGIPVNEILREMGLSWEKLGKSSVSGQAFIDAFLRKAGEYAGAVDRMQGSWSAMLGALSDAKDVGLRELFAGIFTALQPVVQEFSDWMLGPGMEKLKQIGEDLGVLTTRLIELGKALFEAGPFSENFSTALGQLSPKLREIWEKISPFIQQGLAWISAHKQEIIAALTGMAAAFGALTIIGGVVALVSALANPLTLVIALAGLLSVAWQKDWGGIQEKTASVWAWLKPTFAGIASWIQTNIPIAIQRLQQKWQELRAMWTSALEAIKSTTASVISIITTWWSAHGQAVTTVAQFTWQSIIAVISGALASIAGIVQGVIAAIQQFWASWGNTIIQIAKNAWGAIQVIVQSSLAIITAIIEAFAAAIRGDWYAFGQNLRVIWDNIWLIIGTTLKTAIINLTIIAKELAKKIVDTIKNTDWISLGKNIIDGMIAGLKNSAGAFVETLQAIVQAAIDALKGFLGIQSPSRLFRDEIAGNIMKGWIQGVQARVPKLEAAMTITAGRMAFAAQPAPQIQAVGTGMGAVTFYAPVTFRVENGQTMRNILRELRK